MRKLITYFAFAVLCAYPLAGFGQANLEKDPAYLPIDKVLDLKTIKPEVNINLPRFLLKDALSDLNTGTNGPALEGVDLADLVKDVKLIRVLVIEANHTNRPALDKAIKALKSELEKKWTTILSVPEEKEHVGVYAMSDPSGESTAGLAVLIADEGDLIIANVVGRVSIGKLMKIASQSNKLPKDFLKKLQGLGGNQTKESAATEKPTDSPKTEPAVAAPKAQAEDSAAK